MIFLISVTLTLNSGLLYADCPSSVNLAIGDKVTDCPRVGLSEATAKKIQLELISADYSAKELYATKDLLTLKDLMIANQIQQTELYKADSMRERAAYDKAQSRTSTSFWVGIGVGVLTVLAGAYAVKSVAK